MKEHGKAEDGGRALTEREAALVRTIREITGRGNNVEIRRKGDGYSVMEVRKRNIAPALQGAGSGRP